MIDYEIFEKVKSIQEKMAEVIDELNGLGEAKEHLFETLIRGANQSIREAEIAIDSLPSSFDDIDSLPMESRVSLSRAEEALRKASGYTLGAEEAGFHQYAIVEAVENTSSYDESEIIAARETLKRYISSGYQPEEMADSIAYSGDNELADYFLEAYEGVNLDLGSETYEALVNNADKFNSRSPR